MRVETARSLFLSKLGTAHGKFSTSGDGEGPLARTPDLGLRNRKHVSTKWSSQMEPVFEVLLGQNAVIIGLVVVVIVGLPWNQA